MSNPGCVEGERIQLFRRANETVRPLLLEDAAEVAWLTAWPELFGRGGGNVSSPSDLLEEETAIPHEIAAPCCAQFAVTREQILQRPLQAYRHFHDWLMRTELSDDVSGRVMEYAWHIIFGKGAVQ